MERLARPRTPPRRGRLPLRSRQSEVFLLRPPVAYPCFPLYWLPEQQGPPRSCLPSSALFGHTFWGFPFSSLLSGFTKADAPANAIANRVFSAKWFCACRPLLSPSLFSFPRLPHIPLTHSH